MDIRVTRKPVNAPALADEMRVVLGEAWQGWSARKADLDHYLLHVPDGTPQATIDAALAVYAAHNPAVLTTEQRLAARRVEALGAVSNADFAALWRAIESASTLAAIKPLVKALLLLQFRVALAAGLTEAENPEG